MKLELYDLCEALSAPSFISALNEIGWAGKLEFDSDHIAFMYDRAEAYLDTRAPEDIRYLKVPEIALYMNDGRTWHYIGGLEIVNCIDFVKKQVSFIRTGSYASRYQISLATTKDHDWHEAFDL